MVIAIYHFTSTIKRKSASRGLKALTISSCHRALSNRRPMHEILTHEPLKARKDTDNARRCLEAEPATL
jgi:hypothetical protein